MSPGKCLQIPEERRSAHSDHSWVGCWEKGDQEQTLMLFCEFGSLFSGLLVEPSENRVWLKQHLWGISLFWWEKVSSFILFIALLLFLCFLLFQPNWRINSLSSPSDIHRMEERKINEQENKRDRKNCTRREKFPWRVSWCVYADGYRQTEAPFHEQPQTWNVVLFREVPAFRVGACLGLGAIQSH